MKKKFTKNETFQTKILKKLIKKKSQIFLVVSGYYQRKSLFSKFSIIKILRRKDERHT